MVWDATVVDGLAPSRQRGSAEAGDAAEEAERRKVEKYQDIAAQGFLIQHVAFETQGNRSPGPFFRELGLRLQSVTKESRSLEFLKQSMSIAIKQGNAASVLGTLREGDPLEVIFYL